MNEIQVPKGFRDICGELAEKFHQLYMQTWNISQKYGCELLMPSIVENADLFMKNMENSSVVVDKEIFTIGNKENLVLRPEMTASTVRYLTNNHINRGRYYYYGPCFRGERPQADRYRQFYQIGVEMINGTNDIYDCMQIIVDIMRILPNNFTILINHMGDKLVREKYESALFEHLCMQELSEVSQLRLKEKRLLRILDSKEEIDKKAIINAPKLYDYLNTDQKNTLNNICSHITNNGLNVKIDNNLVRGLDYYSGLLFEIVDNSTNLAIGGGGEYNNLLYLDNQYLPCIGFAFGVDRMAKYINIEKKVAILLAGADVNEVNKYADKLRQYYMVSTYIIDTNTRDYKKIPTIANAYNCNNTIILYDNDVRINTQNISYHDLNNIETVQNIINDI